MSNAWVLLATIAVAAGAGFASSRSPSTMAAIGHFLSSIGLGIIVLSLVVMVWNAVTQNSASAAEVGAGNRCTACFLTSGFWGFSIGSV